MINIFGKRKNKVSDDDTVKANESPRTTASEKLKKPEFTVEMVNEYMEAINNSPRLVSIRALKGRVKPIFETFVSDTFEVFINTDNVNDFSGIPAGPQSWNAQQKKRVLYAIVETIGLSRFILMMEQWSYYLQTMTTYLESIRIMCPIPIPDEQIPEKYKDNASIYKLMDEGVIKTEREAFDPPSLICRLNVKLDSPNIEGSPFQTLVYVMMGDFFTACSDVIAEESSNLETLDAIKNPNGNASRIDGMSGQEFEQYCAMLLEKRGFINIQTTKVSGDQGIDIIATKDGVKYGIQCKCYSSSVGNSAVQEAIAGKMYYRCHVAAVMTNSRFTESAKELAEKGGVILWDRDFVVGQSQ